MKISKVKISDQDLVYQYFPVNYTEVLECTFTSEKEITADDIQVAFWTHSPKWISRLFTLRDWLVKPFGIQSGSNDKNINAFAECIRTGGSYRFVTIPCKSENETILCANDTHLVMYFSVKIDPESTNVKRLTITTLVKFHNLLGRLYFYTILPFHYIIVKSMIKHTIKRIS